MKRIIFLFVLSLFLMSYSRPRYGGTLRVELSEQGNPLSWDSLLYRSLMYSNLFMLDKKGKLYSFIFSNWYKEEGKWHLKLKPALLYHDSTPVFPSDVANSIGNFIKSKLPGSFSLSKYIVSIGIKPPDEIIIETSKEVNLPLLLSTPYLFLKKQGKFSGPFYPEDSFVLHANKFFFLGRPFLDTIKIVSSPDEFDMGPGPDMERVPVNFKGYIVYLIVSPRYWKKLSRRAIFTFISSLGWENKVDSYLPPELSQFSLDFPKVRASRVKAYLRRKIILALPPSFSSLIPEIETAAEAYRIKVESYMSSDPLSDLLSGKANVILIPSQSVFLSNETEEVLGMIERYRLTEFYSGLRRILKRLENAFLEEENEEKEIAAAYEYIASREFFFPISFVKERFYLSKRFNFGGNDFYGRPLFWKIRIKINPSNEEPSAPSSQGF